MKHIKVTFLFFAAAISFEALPHYAMGLEFHYEGDFDKAGKSDLSLLVEYKKNDSKVGAKTTIDFTKDNSTKSSLFCSQDMNIMTLQGNLTLENKAIRPHFKVFPIYKQNYSPALIDNAVLIAALGTNEINTIIYTDPIKKQLIKAHLEKAIEQSKKATKKTFEMEKELYKNYKLYLEPSDRAAIKKIIKAIEGKL